MTAWRSWKLLVASLALRSTPALAQSAEPSKEAGDRFELSASSETYVRLFRRALLPGANGALVSSDTEVPIHQYAFIQATNLDTPWHKDSLDFQLAAWGRAWLGPRDAEQPFDGDIQVANARYRQGPVSLRVGRQQLAGGAARFVRFDGANVEAELGAGLDANAYAGWTVLPRW